MSAASMQYERRMSGWAGAAGGGSGVTGVGWQHTGTSGKVKTRAVGPSMINSS